MGAAVTAATQAERIADLEERIADLEEFACRIFGATQQQFGIHNPAVHAQAARDIVRRIGTRRGYIAKESQ
jgi:hypothetical protein